MMSTIKQLNHVAILVEDLDTALSFWRDILGLEVSHIEDVPEQQAVVAFLPTGNTILELVRPTSADSGSALYLKKKGPGIHHLCFEVEDLEVHLKQLEREGIRLVNSEPVVGAGGTKIAFIHPTSTHGVLIELRQTPRISP
jgi:methylmalonyl-CoA/ethylmalonyl-CoA epimerase